MRGDGVRRLSGNIRGRKKNNGPARVSNKAVGAREESVKVFHAGTTERDGDFYTSGGRVLGVTARAADLQTAVGAAYEACAKIGFEGAHYRKDIAARALKKS